MSAPTLQAPTVAATGPVPVVPEGHRPHLDGLRTVAVYLVVLFHAGIAGFSGGFIGVDLFFVLSGYLVTQVLLRDVGGHGRVRLARFYARRVRRLLPASAVALLGTALTYAWVATDLEVREALPAFQASFLYWANWYFVRESNDYFAGDQSQSPVLHFWSLAVEEQFYLVWPLVLVGVAAVAVRLAGTRRWTAVRTAVAGLAAVSLAWAWLQSTADPVRAYYGTDARVYQLLAGALLALSPTLVAKVSRWDRWATPAAFAGLAGLLVLATPWVSARPVARGAWAALATVVVLVALERGAGPLRSILSTGPMVHLGQISYGTYLWHWPVIVVLARTTDLGPGPIAVLAAAVATGLASLSSTLVERPLRHSPWLDGHPRAVVVGGLAVSIVCAVVLIPAVLSESRAPKATGEAVEGLVLTPVPRDFDQLALHDEGFRAPERACVPDRETVCTSRFGDGLHVVLLGDSTAQNLEDPLFALAEREGWTLTVANWPSCPWQRGQFYEMPEAQRRRCDAAREPFYTGRLEALGADLVVASNVFDSDSMADPSFGGNPTDAAMRAATESSVERILASGARLLVVEPMTRAPAGYDPLTCLASSAFQEQCRFEADQRPYWAEDQLRELAGQHDGMATLDLDPVVCPRDPVCDPVLEGEVVRWDGAHLTRRFSRTLVDELGAAVASLSPPR
jgi:peptidoglycan/LPS O-acetylase OafA/YrhL